jgi:hypothetical protein
MRSGGSRSRPVRDNGSPDPAGVAQMVQCNVCFTSSKSWVLNSIPTKINEKIKISGVICYKINKSQIFRSGKQTNEEQTLPAHTHPRETTEQDRIHTPSQRRPNQAVVTGCRKSLSLVGWETNWQVSDPRECCGWWITLHLVVTEDHMEYSWLVLSEP